MVWFVGTRGRKTYRRCTENVGAAKVAVREVQGKAEVALLAPTFMNDEVVVLLSSTPLGRRSRKVAPGRQHPIPHWRANVCVSRNVFHCYRGQSAVHCLWQCGERNTVNAVLLADNPGSSAHHWSAREYLFSINSATAFSRRLRPASSWRSTQNLPVEQCRGDKVGKGGNRH